MIYSILKIIGFVLAGVTVLFFTILFYRGCSARKKPALQRWHDAPEWQDNLFQNEYANFTAYFAAEKKFLDDIYNDVQLITATSYNRYTLNNPSSPYVKGNNLNASFELLPEVKEIQGGILLVHGLKDSPYHLLAIGQIFADNGYYVLGLRLPGHGTVPGALLNVSWKDWYAATQFGARMVLKKIENVKGSKFYVGGFSTGAALTLRYVLDAVADKDLRVPDKLLLLSPAIGVNPFAEVTDWHKLISWIPFFEKFKWIDVKPEYDPFKYNSFPKNAADQVFDLTKANWKLIEKIAKDETKKEKMPPIYAFQSRVDATVKTDKLLEMFAKIAPEQSELLLFDVNRVFESAMKEKLTAQFPDSEQLKAIKAKVMVVSNRAKSNQAGFGSNVEIKTLSLDKNEEIQSVSELETLIDIEWPESVFALSHVCIPISPDDRYYGKESLLGSINAKGEHKVLLIGDDLTRLRYNPFFNIIKNRLEISFVNSDESK
ncbi:MAG: alpha/beta fold hydrolase [bacterium]|nr:MAG: alpha/beta fold hydrolase [bacterium]